MGTVLKAKTETKVKWCHSESHFKKICKEPHNVKVMLIVVYNIHSVILCYAHPQDRSVKVLP